MRTFGLGDRGVVDHHIAAHRVNGEGRAVHRLRGRQLGERLIGWREYREGSFALQRADEVGRLERRRQSLERSGRG